MFTDIGNTFSYNYNFPKGESFIARSIYFSISLTAHSKISICPSLPIVMRL